MKKREYNTLKNMFDDCVIMAGGSGTRLWPASSSRLPKQFLPVSENKSFFSISVKRALAVTNKNGYVIIITGRKHIPHVIKDLAKFNENEKKRFLVIGEPIAKNTAPAVACAVTYSFLMGGSRNMLVLTSDHIIKPIKIFKADAALAADSAKQGKLVVFGIQPTRPETGYGYIEAVKTVTDMFNVTAFHEKPDLQTAKKYMKKKNFFWNSGMFAFSAKYMADAFHSLAPDVINPYERLKPLKPEMYTFSQGIRIVSSWPGLENAYRKTKNISFDYAIAEKCADSVMVRAGFDWIDIGNWDEYIKIHKKNTGKVFSVSGDSCYVDSEIPVALVGVEDLIVIIRSGKNNDPAAALITKKGYTQNVKEIVEQIKKTGNTDLL